MKTSKKLMVAVLAIVFTIGLTYASVELPHQLSKILLKTIDTPGYDATYHADETEAFIGGHHLRWIGVAGLILTALLIVVGLIAERRGLAAVGALLFFLPVFGHFAASMFFLAGLAMLRVVWLPILEISHEVLSMGDVVYLPYATVVYPLVNLGLDIRDHLPWPVMGLGIGIFVISTIVWMTARIEGRGVAASWMYRISRHPQYLGWILWSYGLLLYVLRHSELYHFKISWGMPSSLPWLISTMVIIGVAMVEEIKMAEANGESYLSFRDRTPFLLPLPSWLSTFIAAPMRFVLRRPWPENGLQVAVVVALYTLILVTASLPFALWDWPPRTGWWGFPTNVWPLVS